MKREFGSNSKGEMAYLYTLTNESGMQVDITNYGAAIVNLIVPNCKGKKYDVVLGYDDVSGYEQGNNFMGAVLGRNANRIADAHFKLNGIDYNLDKNNGNNNLHSGNNYYNKRMWEINEVDDNNISFYLESSNMDQGYPGDATIEVMYELTDNNELIIRYYGKCKEDTIMNLTNHSFFNLNGHDSGTILEQSMWINADGYTESNDMLVPTGNIVDVSNTPMDFRKPKPIGRDIECDYKPLKEAGGYDHNYALNSVGKFRKVASLHSDKSGINMEVYSERPGMQIYTSCVVDNEKGKDGAIYNKYQGVCFETQFFPDAINQPKFESPILKSGDIYKSVTKFKFIV